MKKELDILINQKIWENFFTEILGQKKYDFRKYFLSLHTFSGIVKNCPDYNIILSFKKDEYGIYGILSFVPKDFSNIAPEIQATIRKRFATYLSENKSKTENGVFDRIYFNNSSLASAGEGILEFSLGQKYSSITGDILHFRKALQSVCDFLYFDILGMTEKIQIHVNYPVLKLFEKGKSSNSDTFVLPDWLQGIPEKEVFSKPVNNESREKVMLSDMGGNKEVKSEIKKLISFYKNRDHFKKWSINPPRGVLLYGPPGTGKTLAAKIIANEINVTFYQLSSTDILSKWIGDSAKNIKKFFGELISPCVVFIDEIDALIPNRDGDKGFQITQEEVQAINAFLQVVDGFESKSDILFIGATNRITSLDPALLRAGRFDCKIFVDFPDFEARKEIWNIYLKKSATISNFQYFDEKVDIDVLAKGTQGFTGADIAEVIRRMLNDYAIGSLISNKIESIINGETTLRGLLYIIEKYKEEKMSSHNLVPSKPETRLKDIGGSTNLKNELQKVIKQYKNRELFEDADISLPRGILLYGPPGTGKTLAARAIAGEVGVLFYALSPKDFLSKWINESVTNIENIFRSLETPCIVFIDEIDALFFRREARGLNHAHQEDIKVINSFLQQIDGFSDKRDILFIGATNRVEAIDDAILRAGRFDCKILVDYPDDAAREEIFRMYVEKSTTKTKKGNLFDGEIDYKKLSEMTDHLTGADICEIIRRVKQSFVMKQVENIGNESKKPEGKNFIQNQDIIFEIQRYMNEKSDASPIVRRIGFGL